MSDYPVGTVAMVSFMGGSAFASVLDEKREWRHKNGYFLDDDLPLDIVPLRVAGDGEVVIKATREDADELAAFANLTECLRDDKASACILMHRIAVAIREQTPNPEPPKRWTVEWREGNINQPGRYHLCDNGTELRDWSAPALQSLADALNEATR